MSPYSRPVTCQLSVTVMKSDVEDEFYFGSVLEVPAHDPSAALQDSGALAHQDTAQDAAGVFFIDIPTLTRRPCPFKVLTLYKWC